VLIDLDSPSVQSVTGEIVGVSQQAISAMVSEGKLPMYASQGEMVQAYCQRLRDQAAGRLGSEVGGLDLVQERAALAREQRLGIEIKNAVARGEFAPISLLSEVLATASQSVVERFEQLPGLLKKSCPDLHDAARDQVMIALASARNEWVRATESLVLAKADADLSSDDEVLDA
jgi:phage terminase Nu1 subunit (DNA packaging protein)